MCQWLVTFCWLVSPIIHPYYKYLELLYMLALVIPESSSSRMCLHMSLTKDPKERRDCNRWPIHLCYLKKSEEHFELKKQDLKNCDPDPDPKHVRSTSLFKKTVPCVQERKRCCCCCCQCRCRSGCGASDSSSSCCSCCLVSMLQYFNHMCCWCWTYVICIAMITLTCEY